MTEPHTQDEQDPIEDLAVDDEAAGEIKGGEDAYRGRYQLRLDQANPIQTQPPPSSP